jgi:hypothetical protein
MHQPSNRSLWTHWSTGLGLFGGLFLATASLAQLPDQLLPAVEQSDEAWDAGRLPQIDAAGVELSGAIAEVDRNFLRLADPANRQRWRDYLRLSELDRLLSDQQLDAETRETLMNRVGIRLQRNAPGLERPPLTRLRKAVIAYEIANREQAGAETQPALVDAQLKRLAEALRAPQVDPAVTTDYASRAAQLLNDARQRPKLLQALRNSHPRSNFFVTIDGPLLNRAIGREVAETQPVEETILGTRFVGTGTLNGQISVEPLESFDRARLMLRMAGEFHSRNRGYNGPVQVQSTGRADVSADKLLILDQDGVRTEPAQATGELESQLLSIEHPMRIVRKLAAKRAAKQKNEVNAIASSRLRQRVASQFDHRLREQLAERDRSTDAPRLTTVLARLGLPQPIQHWSSDAYSIRLAGRLADQGQLGAPHAPPPVHLQGASIQVHETLVHNITTPLLAGRTMTSDDFRALAEQLGMSAADNPPEEDEPFTIKFARLRPVVFEARDGQLRIGVRGAAFQRGEQSIQRPLEVTAIYSQATGPDQRMILQRDGELRVDFPGRQQLSWQEAGLKGAIRKSFARAFPEQVFAKPVELPLAERGTLPLRLARAQSQGGWLSLNLAP